MGNTPRNSVGRAGLSGCSVPAIGGHRTLQDKRLRQGRAPRGIVASSRRGIVASWQARRIFVGRSHEQDGRGVGTRSRKQAEGGRTIERDDIGTCGQPALAAAKELI